MEEDSEEKMDTRSADQPPSKFYHHSYCPLNEKSYEIIYDLIGDRRGCEAGRYVHGS